eukprot:gene12193-12330_t
MAAAASGFLCWGRWRGHQDDSQRHQPMHKQARRLQDSMVLTKKRSLDAQTSGFPDEEEELPAKAMSGKEREEASHVVVFEHLGEEDRKLLKAASIKDSVIITHHRRTSSKAGASQTGQPSESSDEPSARPAVPLGRTVTFKENPMPPTASGSEQEQTQEVSSQPEETMHQ